MRTHLSNAAYGILDYGAYPIEGTAMAKLTYAVASFVLRSVASLIEQPGASVEVLS